MSREPFYLRTRNLSLLVLAVLCAFLYGYRLGTPDFRTSDEARRALVVRSMVASGNYAIPTLSGHAYLRKPPLYYWLAALVQRVSGSQDEWVYRLPSALAATGSVLFLFLTASRFLSRRASFLASVMLATCAMFLVYGGRAGIDMTLGFLVTLSVYFLVRARETAWRGWPVWGFWTALGLALLTKGPIGIFFPLATALILSAGPGFTGEIRRARPIQGLLVVLAIALPWALAIIQQIGAEPALALLGEEMLGGFRGENIRHAQPFYFYLYETPAQFLPYAFFIPAGLLALREPRAPRERDLLRLAGAWLIPALVVFSMSHQKRAYYLLPSFGALSLWIGWTVDRFLLSAPSAGERAGARRLARLGLITLTGLGAVGALAGSIYLRWQRPQLFATAGIALAAVALWSMFGLVSARRGRPGRALGAVVACAMLYVGTARGPLALWYNEHESPRLAALQIARAVPPEADLLSLFRTELFIEAYVGRPVERVETDRELRRRLEGREKVYVLMERLLYPQRKPLLPRVVLPSIGSPGGRFDLLLASN